VDKDQADRIERKLDQILELAPTIDSLGQILVRQGAATNRLGLNRNTLAKNDKVEKFEEVGGRKTYIQIADIAAVKRRKSTRKRNK
jgi:hypothetical protein